MKLVFSIIYIPIKLPDFDRVFLPSYCIIFVSIPFRIFISIVITWDIIIFIFERVILL